MRKASEHECNSIHLCIDLHRQEVAVRHRQASRTAEYNAAFRALEAAKPPGSRVLDDPYSERLLPAGLRLARRLCSLPVVGHGLVGCVDRRWPGVRSSVVARTPLIDDWLSAAVQDDGDQVLVLGAGLDTRAWRLPALARTAVYEVDHPSTSAAKQKRLAAWGADLRRVRFVAVDFDRQSLADRLQASGFDASRRTVALWDGVTNYLPAGAVDAVMRWLGQLPRGSHVIFTYIDAAVLADASGFAGAGRVVRSVQRSGEPSTFGIAPERLAPYLA
jgi:methyltransferase (TIGR00027 family)